MACEIIPQQMKDMRTMNQQGLVWSKDPYPFCFQNHRPKLEQRPKSDQIFFFFRFRTNTYLCILAATLSPVLSGVFIIGTK